MTRGPAGGPRPFIKTRLKYDVKVRVKGGIFTDPPKATDLIDMRVNAPQENSNEFIKNKIGKVILAANGLAHPSRTRLISDEINTDPIGGEFGDVEMELTYVILGAGVGEFADTTITSKRAWTLHEVLVEENDSLISGSSVQREWNPAPYKVNRVEIGTD